MTALRPLTALAFAALLAGAAAAQETVRVDGGDADRAHLEGTWDGAYASEETGRSGTLLFTLGPGAESAVATLEMMPRATPETPSPEPILLALHIVEVAASGVPGELTVRGALAPYDDPEWGLPLETHFTGTLLDGRIEGTFASLPTTVDSIPTSGRWWATRRPDTADL
jgi:hypothetical protein